MAAAQIDSTCMTLSTPMGLASARCRSPVGAFRLLCCRLKVSAEAVSRRKRSSATTSGPLQAWTSSTALKVSVYTGLRVSAQVGRMSAARCRDEGSFTAGTLIQMLQSSMPWPMQSFKLSFGLCRLSCRPLTGCAEGFFCPQTHCTGKWWAMAPLVDKLFEGLGASVLAYCQTGSGKTYTQ